MGWLTCIAGYPVLHGVVRFHLQALDIMPTRTYLVDMKPKYIAFLFVAKSDGNGNSRRGWLITDSTTGECVRFVDVQSRGDSSALRADTADLGDVIEGPTVEVGPAHWKQWKRICGKKG